MSTEPTLAEIIRLAIDSRLSDLHVALPGRIESFDATTQTAEILPTIRRAIRDENGDIQHEELPVIPDVPILFPRGSADLYSITWPLAKGDFVLLLFNSWAIGQWRESGDISNPVDLRRHSLGNPVAIPGIGPKDELLPYSATAMVIEGSTVQVGISATAYVALDTLVRARIEELADAILNGTTTPNDGGAGLQVDAKTTLDGLGWGGGGVVPPTVASTILKAE